MSSIGIILTEFLALLIESIKAVTAPVSLAVFSNCCVRSLTASTKSSAASSTAGWWFTA